MASAANGALGERIAEWIAHFEHHLPAQAPLRDFVHHNTLHGYQHLPFFEALASAGAKTGARAYWPESRFRAELARGRIGRDDLAAALDELGVEGLDEQLAPATSRRELLLAILCGDETTSVRTEEAWLAREHGLDADPLFALARALTVDISTATDERDWRQAGRDRWRALCASVGRTSTWRELLEQLFAVDVLATVRTVLQRHLAAHLDRGLAAWRNPDRERGFYAAWRASAGADLQWELEELPNLRDEIACLPDDPLSVLAEELPRLVPEALWPAYCERLLLELPGWSGMFLRCQGPGDGAERPPVAMLDLLAVRVLLERLLCEEFLRRASGQALTLESLPAWYDERPAEIYVRHAWRTRQLDEELAAELAHVVGRALEARFTVDWENWAKRIAAALPEPCPALRLWRLWRALAVLPEAARRWDVGNATAALQLAAALSPRQRGEIWLLAYERHYRERLFAALAANHGRGSSPRPVSAQVVMCMDDREEGTRRHLEEIAPQVETYGAAGFFGVAMYWQGLGDGQPTALCPVVVRPDVLVSEEANADAARLALHLRRRERRLRWRERLYQATRGEALAAPLLTAAAAVPALAALLADSLAPAWFGQRLRRWREACEVRPPSELALNAETQAAGTPEAPRRGFTDGEQVDRVAAFLRGIGLSRDFAPLVLLLGHGSRSVNNPHRSAYDCGACSGRHGGPNARVFAAMANRREVRAGLAACGIVIPDETWFVGAFHNTCDDTVEYYDLDRLPAAFLPPFTLLRDQLAAACRGHAVERCRRLASAPPDPSPAQALRHVAGRADDLSQARPELGHATNAAAFIGRRRMSRGLFLDRRVFLISYDPTQDEDGCIVEGILLAAGPVGAGLSLEYYFSCVDNEAYGCGSKISHNLSGLIGVMEGCESDLRTGLPQQMIDIHEPMRLLLVVEQTPAMLGALLARQPALQSLIANAWVLLAAQDPESGVIHRLLPGGGWQRWQGELAVPHAASSLDWFRGRTDPLPPALLPVAAHEEEK